MPGCALAHTHIHTRQRHAVDLFYSRSYMSTLPYLQKKGKKQEGTIFHFNHQCQVRKSDHSDVGLTLRNQRSSLHTTGHSDKAHGPVHAGAAARTLLSSRRTFDAAATLTYASLHIPSEGRVCQPEPCRRSLPGRPTAAANGRLTPKQENRINWDALKSNLRITWDAIKSNFRTQLNSRVGKFALSKLKEFGATFQTVSKPRHSGDHLCACPRL